MAETVPYALLGGEAALSRLIERFYDLMDSEPKTHGIRKLPLAQLAGTANWMRNQPGDLPGQP